MYIIPRGDVIFSSLPLFYFIYKRGCTTYKIKMVVVTLQPFSSIQYYIVILYINTKVVLIFYSFPLLFTGGKQNTKKNKGDGKRTEGGRKVRGFLILQHPQRGCSFVPLLSLFVVSCSFTPRRGLFLPKEETKLLFPIGEQPLEEKKKLKEKKGDEKQSQQ